MSRPEGWTIDHIGIAVPDLDAGIEHYVGLADCPVMHRESLHEQGVELVFLPVGGTDIELLAPLRDNTPLAQFLDKRGPGLHHVCYRVRDIEFELKRLEKLGMRLLDRIPRPGARGSRIAFIHPDSCQGILTEICDYPVP